MRIVHFSDIHFGCGPRALSAFADKRILGTLNFYLRRRALFQPELLQRGLARIRLLAPDLVICTGDLTSVGAPEEFAAAREALDPFAAALSGRFLYVPGNHDAYVRNKRCRRLLAETFHSLNSGRWNLAELPLEWRRGQVHLFLVNEAVPCNWFLSTGRVDTETAARLTAWLDAPRDASEKRILVGHFPLRDEHGQALGWRRSLRGGTLLHEALRDGRLDVALCGHEHTPFLRYEPNGSLEICAGSLTARGRINVLDFIPETGEFRQFWIDLCRTSGTPLPVSDELAVAATGAE